MGGLTGVLLPSGEVSLEEVLSNAVFFSIFQKYLAEHKLVDGKVLPFMQVLDAPLPACTLPAHRVHTTRMPRADHMHMQHAHAHATCTCTHACNMHIHMHTI